MAAISLACLSITHPEISSSSTTKTKSVHKNHRKPNSSLFPSLHKTKRSIIVSVAGNSSESSTPPLPIPERPEIELQFIGPKAGDPVLKASAISGDKLMRDIMVDNKIELYAAYGKLMNCGGGGSCGTCIVEIIDGNDLLNERTNTELRYLKKKPESWRLACQTIVGDKQNSGKVVVQRLPQWKK